MHGNVGDKPVGASLYIEGYQPQAYNLTGTLQADESKNVFTFVYRKVKAEEPTQPRNTGNNSTGNTGNTGNNGANTGNNGNTGTSTTGTTGTTQTQTEQGTQTPGQGQEQTGEEPESGPAQEDIPEVIDIDDEETPLAGAGTAEAVDETGIGNDAIGLGVLLRTVAILAFLGVVGLTIWWKLTDRKDKK
jgi:hypothetical protein